jgi:hypothetical protein
MVNLDPMGSGAVYRSRCLYSLPRRSAVGYLCPAQMSTAMASAALRTVT